MFISLPRCGQKGRGLESCRWSHKKWRQTCQTRVTVIGCVFVSVFVCCFSVAKSCPTLCNPMNRNTTGFLSPTISQSLLNLMSNEWVMPSYRLLLCRCLSYCPQSCFRDSVILRLTFLCSKHLLCVSPLHLL